MFQIEFFPSYLIQPVIKRWQRRKSSEPTWIGSRELKGKSRYQLGFSQAREQQGFPQAQEQKGLGSLGEPELRGEGRREDGFNSGEGPRRR